MKTSEELRHLAGLPSEAVLLLAAHNARENAERQRRFAPGRTRRPSMFATLRATMRATMRMFDFSTR